MQQRKTCCHHHIFNRKSAVLNKGESCIISLFLKQTNAIILTSTQLTWQTLQPDSAQYQSVFSRIADEETDTLATVQPRLLNALAHLHHQTQGFPLLLVRSQENRDYLTFIARPQSGLWPTVPLYSAVITISWPTTSRSSPLRSSTPIHQSGWYSLC